MKWTSNSDKKEWNTGLKKGWLVHRSGEVNHSKLICNLFWFLAVRISKKLKSAYKHEKIGQISCQGTFAIAISFLVQPDQYLQKMANGKSLRDFHPEKFPEDKNRLQWNRHWIERLPFEHRVWYRFNLEIQGIEIIRLFKIVLKCKADLVQKLTWN